MSNIRKFLRGSQLMSMRKDLQQAEAMRTRARAQDWWFTKPSRSLPAGVLAADSPSSYTQHGFLHPDPLNVAHFIIPSLMRVQAIHWLANQLQYFERRNISILGTFCDVFTKVRLSFLSAHQFFFWKIQTNSNEKPTYILEKIIIQQGSDPIQLI